MHVEACCTWQTRTDARFTLTAPLHRKEANGSSFVSQIQIALSATVASYRDATAIKLMEKRNTKA